MIRYRSNITNELFLKVHVFIQSSDIRKTDEHSCARSRKDITRKRTCPSDALRAPPSLSVPASNPSYMCCDPCIIVISGQCSCLRIKRKENICSCRIGTLVVMRRSRFLSSLIQCIVCNIESRCSVSELVLVKTGLLGDWCKTVVLHLAPR